MADLKNPLFIHLKGWLFLLIMLVAAGLLILQRPHWRTATLVLLVMWSSARFYYYLFYVIEKYVDPDFKFSGVVSVLKYFLSRNKDNSADDQDLHAADVPPKNE